METKPTSESDSPDTDPRINTKSPATTPLNDTTEMVAAALVADITGHHDRSRFFEDESDGSDDILDGFVADVTTIVQSQCARWESYTDIETLVSHLPIDHLTFAAHDSLAPYSGGIRW